MKNGFYFLGGLLLLAGLYAPDSYRLVGNLSGLDGTRMLLVPAATHKQKPIGEAVVEDGKFVSRTVTRAAVVKSQAEEAVILCLYAGKR